MGTYAIGTAALKALIGMAGSECKKGARAVLPGSLEAGTIEDRFFRPPSPGEADRMLKAAERAAAEGRGMARAERAGSRTLSAFERLTTKLTSSAVSIYQELTRLFWKYQGRVFPSYDHFVNATGFSRSTVFRSLAVLEQLGFLVRQRRFKRIEGQGPGPRYQQTSNAYRLELPKAMTRYLPAYMRPAPLPVDEAWRREAEIETTRRQVQSLPLDEFARMTGSDNELTKALERLGAAWERSQSAENRGQPADQAPMLALEIA